jgi:hypothetical protein
MNISSPTTAPIFFQPEENKGSKNLEQNKSIISNSLRPIREARVIQPKYIYQLRDHDILDDFYLGDSRSYVSGELSCFTISVGSTVGLNFGVGCGLGVSMILGIGTGFAAGVGYFLCMRSVHEH